MIKDPQLRKFLSREITTMASLDHVNVVKLIRTFEGILYLTLESDWYFLVMEYC
jgi:hypothetical protein